MNALGLHMASGAENTSSNAEEENEPILVKRPKNRETEVQAFRLGHDASRPHVDAAAQAG